MSSLAPIDEGLKRRPVDAPYPSGYTAPRIFLHRLRWFSRTNLPYSIAIALFDLAVMIATPIVAAWAIALVPLTAIVIVPLSWIIVSRALRGLECLTHESSHMNLTRKRWLNDAVGNIFAAVPTFQLVHQFRAAHIPKHHQRFGTSVDPDLLRYDTLEIHSIDRSLASRFTKDILIRLPRYLGGWFWSTGSSALTLILGLVWHVGFFIAPLVVLFGEWKALILWAVFFVVPFLTVLPVLRLIGEAAEHIYLGSSTVFAATVSNVGLVHRLLVHPHGDGFHLIHHLWPSVPHHNLRHAHRELSANDPNGFGKSRQRISLLQEPPYPTNV